jgi:hypothetical protein
LRTVIASSSEPQDLDEIAVQLELGGDLCKITAVPLRSIHSYLEDTIRVEGDSCPVLKTYTGSYMVKEKARPAHFRQL